MSLAYDEMIQPELIEKVIRRYIVRKPILPVTDFNFVHVVRSSPNNLYPGEVFKNVSRCSYNPKPETISLQRCNYEKQQVFYAAVASGKTFKATGTAFMETGFSYAKDKNVSRMYFTLSRWELSRPLRMFVLPFSKRSTRNNDDFKMMNKHFRKLLRQAAAYYNEDPTDIEEFLKFISHVYTSPFRKKHYYKISSAFFNAIMYYGEEIDGLIYPSAMTRAEGMNIAVRKDLIDQQVLNCDLAVMFAMQRTPGKVKDVSFMKASSVAYPDRKGNLKFEYIY